MPHRAAQAEIADAARDFEEPLLRYATRILGDREQARDVVQDTFLRLHQASQTDAGLLRRPRPWLYRVCRNRALDVRRRRRPQCDIEDIDPAVEASSFDHRAAGEVVELFDRLPDKQRRVLELRFGEDRTYRSIGEATGISTGQVGYLIHEGLGNLRRWLGVAAFVLMVGGGLAIYQASTHHAEHDRATEPAATMPESASTLPAPVERTTSSPIVNVSVESSAAPAESAERHAESAPAIAATTAMPAASAAASALPKSQRVPLPNATSSAPPPGSRLRPHINAEVE